MCTCTVRAPCMHIYMHHMCMSMCVSRAPSALLTRAVLTKGNRRTAYYLLLTAYCLLLTAYCSLLTAHCYLLIATGLLLTAHYLLLTTYYGRAYRGYHQSSQRAHSDLARTSLAGTSLAGTSLAGTSLARISLARTSLAGIQRGSTTTAAARYRAVSILTMATRCRAVARHGVSSAPPVQAPLRLGGVGEVVLGLGLGLRLG